jgi:signal transduction histidine kinase
VSAVRPPDATGPVDPPGREPVRLAPADSTRRGPVPQSFQTRLTIAFMGVVALTLLLVAPIVVLRMDAYFRAEEERQLEDRTAASKAVLMKLVEDAAGTQPVVLKQDGRWTLNPAVERMLIEDGSLQLVADQVAQAKVKLAFGPASTDTDGMLVPDPVKRLTYLAESQMAPDPGQAVDTSISATTSQAARLNDVQDWGLAVTLTDPYTTRAATIGAINGLLLIMAAVALLLAVLVASFLAHRFATPLTRLTAASRRLAGGDFSSRVALDEITTGTLEIRSVSRQFNVMASRLEESVEVIRRDRDRSRDFLADVSHELRTPIAAMRTFVELLQGPAGEDPSARAEFLESSAGQLDRLDWLAQNLLELSKLDSGLVLLELRPEDLRGTIESAVEQQMAAAEKRGVRMVTVLPDRPLRFQHDPPRVGQVVTNLVGNAIKFTPRGGEVRVTARSEPDGGARIEVVDTGIGIKASELPLVFDRFYRGSGSNEARGSGSGLGLSIVKSIVDMHHGTIAVESAVGRGTRFVVSLPRDPREVLEVAPSEPDAGSAWPAPTPSVPKVEVSSPSATPPVNTDAALLTQAAAPGAPGNPIQPESPTIR